MLELPESYTISKQMQQILTGKRICHIELLHTPHKFAFFHGDMDKYADYLEGQVVAGATYHGGMIEIDTEDSMIVFADGAYPKYYVDKKKFPKNHQMAIYFNDETAIFVSVQMYGFINVSPKRQATEGYYISSSSKPNPLTDEFTFEYFKGLYPTNGKKCLPKHFLPQSSAYRDWEMVCCRIFCGMQEWILVLTCVKLRKRICSVIKVGTSLSSARTRYMNLV